jgi:hypothetical protein
MFNIDSILEKWLRENRDIILKNISDTILVWLENHKDEIYTIIEKSSKGNHE